MASKQDERKRFFAGISHAPDPVIRQWVCLIAATWGALDAERKDTRNERSYGAALAIINDFRLRQDLGAEQSPETLRWLSEALGRIVEHKDPLHSLGLKPRAAHRPSSAALAIDVGCWIACVEMLGYSPDDADSLAADLFGKDLKSIQRYKRDAGGWVSAMNPDIGHWRRHFDARGKALPRDKKSQVPVPTRRR